MFFHLQYQFCEKKEGAEWVYILNTYKMIFCIYNFFVENVRFNVKLKFEKLIFKIKKIVIL